MPEGDTVHRTARRLHQALAGHVVARLESVFPAIARAPLVGRTVESVSAAGKWLVVRFSGNLSLVSHLRMHGEWHLYRRGERWRHSRRDMRLVLGTDVFEAIAFNLPIAELVDTRSLAHHPVLGSLGPDLLADDFDAAEAVRRLHAQSSRPLADVLLDQHVMAGIGNVYKSELLFALRLDPASPVGALDEATLARIVRMARAMMRANVMEESCARRLTWRGYRRTTGRANPQERLWVYGRGGRPCRRCGMGIEFARQGPDARMTYWCPKCQKTADRR